MNSHLKLISKHQFIKVETANSPFSKGIEPGTVLDIPIAHKEGNYFIDEQGLKTLQENDQILFRYCDAEGAYAANPNGAMDNIAGILNTKRNVLGMMPHPERAATDSVSSKDGKKIFEAIERYFDGSL
jgi:phosphoribosylformylglycinamidine synthase